MHHSPYFHQPGINLVNEHGRPMRSHEILVRFGLPPSSPIPHDYCAQMWIGNTLVNIYPSKWLRKPNRRVTATCNHCGRQVCAGHLHQHLRACNGATP